MFGLGRNPSLIMLTGRVEKRIFSFTLTKDSRFCHIGRCYKESPLHQPSLIIEDEMKLQTFACVQSLQSRRKRGSTKN